MPEFRYKTYFPVSHDLNHDPEIQELIDQFGVAGLRMWLELLSLADKAQNEIKVSREWFRSLCRLVQCHQKRGFAILEFFLKKKYILLLKPKYSENNFIFCLSNYWKYHRTTSPIVPEVRDNSHIESSSKTLSLILNPKNMTLENDEIEQNRGENDFIMKNSASNVLKIQDSTSPIVPQFSDLWALDTAGEEAKQKNMPPKSLNINNSTSRISENGVVRRPAEVPEQVWKDFLAMRAKKKSPLTPTAWEGFLREVDKTGRPLEKMIRLCCLRGWTAIRADWDLSGADDEDEGNGGEGRRRKEVVL